MKLIERARLAWRVMTYRPGNLMAHAEMELGAGFDIEVKELLLVFSSQGHSGGSAAVTTELVGKLMRYEPIGPLLGTDDEWVEVAEAAAGRPGLFQNRRCGRVFRVDGEAYDVDGIVWQEPDGGGTVNYESRVPVTFPYTPKTEYRPRPA